jgi:Flp pilus assembly protein TadG
VTLQAPTQAAVQLARRAERGSLTVEFVLLAPLLIVLMLFLVLAGRVVEAHGQVDGAARDAARAASLARSPGQAVTDAQAAVNADIHGWCPGVIVNGFVQGSTAVTVTLHCSLDLTFLGVGNVAITGYAVAPLDQFVARTF